jgi:hypothetical protein
VRPIYKVTASFPVSTGGLCIGGPGLFALVPNNGGQLDRNFISVPFIYNYPQDIQCFSPVTVMGNGAGSSPMTVGLQWMSEKLHPNYNGSQVHMNMFSTSIDPKHSGTKPQLAPLMQHTLEVELSAGEETSYSVAIGISTTGE